MDGLVYWLWLTNLPHVGVKTQRKLIEYFGDALRVYEADDVAMQNSNLLNVRQLNAVKNRSLDYAQRLLERCNKLGIAILPATDKRYPERFQKGSDAPVLLYYKGEIEAMRLEKTVGIVGARRCTQTAKRLTGALAEYLTAEGYTIVSGMAKGVDSYGHTACLNAGGQTVAVLGNGLDICYPSEHKSLYEAIIDRGVMLSEYAPCTKPSSFTFPARNRIIAEWSDRLFVINPGRNSGSFITESLAKNLGKEALRL